MAGHSKWSEIKRQKGLTEGRDRARQASLRAIAGGERPVYRPRVEPDGDLLIVCIPELDVATQARQPSEAAAMARDCVATWLGIDPDAFDVVIEDYLITCRATGRVASTGWELVKLAGDVE